MSAPFEHIESVYWVFTQLCNDTCAHCYNDSGPRGTRMPAEECLAIVGNLPASVGRLILSGGEPLTEHRDDEVVRHEVAARHDGLGLEPERRAVAHGSTQHVAGRDVGQAAIRRDPGCLRALAGARRAHQDQIERHGYFRKPL